MYPREMETIRRFLDEHPEVLYGGVGAAALVSGGALIYKVATRKKPTHANVNCWFCSQSTVVPYGNRNCWDCPTCEQYNGFQENGDYNKPIPAQYLENLNHGVSASLPPSDPPQTLQWVNTQMLLCRKCNNNQSSKIKQLASFTPRDDENYDEEVEAYKHHLEQTYRLCRPCQAAVEYYIKYQNRQLRTGLLTHQLRRGRDADNGFVKSPASVATPAGVILLRVLAFLTATFLLAVLFSSWSGAPPGDPAPPTLPGAGQKNQSGAGGGPAWRGLLERLPAVAVETARRGWRYGRDNQMAVASGGLLGCVTAVLLAGPLRLRRIDAVAAVLWLLLLVLYLAEGYLAEGYLVEGYLAGAPGWLDAAKLGTAALCCLVCFGAAVATRKSVGPRRARGRRYLAGQPPPPLYPGLTDPFIPTPPPSLSKLAPGRRAPPERRASPSSLPGRLNRALCLGTIPSLTRTDSGYLFSGSRPASQCQDSPSSDYFSLKSGSRPSSPAPSLAGSVTSTSSSARQRRPLISPARLNISGRKLRLFSHEAEPLPMSPPLSPPLSPNHCYAEPAPSVCSGRCAPDLSPYPGHSELRSFQGDGSVIGQQKGSSSGSSACMVDTTTQGLEPAATSPGLVKRFVWPGLLLASLSVNLIFSALYVYRSWA
ncbi:transmembrane protein 201 isoform X2 [Gadus chalcogrammus]|uniref:transmembrane protein 201 isoform X2 n=1 Tax=Gadus chalcogrammus TaxID=1042646 RepID=UPI0024C2146F|nr:transmembrane protein 201 isoform X2 [Gadus chalcogrammus]